MGSSVGVLRKRLPPGEQIIWISAPKGSRARLARLGAKLLNWAVVFALFAYFPTLAIVSPGFLTIPELAGFGALTILFTILMLYHTWDTEIAVLTDHVVWNDRGILAWLSKKGFPKVRLDSIDYIDAEEGDGAVTLHCGSKSHRIKEIIGGEVAGFARATGRPASVWRRCMSPQAIRARRWSRVTALLGFALAAVPLCVLFPWTLHAWLQDSASSNMLTFAIVVALIIAAYAGGVAGEMLPHLLVGRSLLDDARRDFICTMADPRWNGQQPKPPEDLAWPPGSFQQRAMRMAYGEIPEYPAWKPEIYVAPTARG